MRSRQGGAALLLMMVALLTLVAALMLGVARDAAEPALVRGARNGEQLGIARDSLLGAARTAWCANPALPADQLLPCPDLSGPEGEAAGACAGTTRGWLPWKTLNLAPLKDASGTCLWYERDGANARVIAAGAPSAGQLRSNLPGRSFCGGNHDSLAYLDPGDPAVGVVIDLATMPAACGSP